MLDYHRSYEWRNDARRERKESRKRTRKYFKNRPRHLKLYTIIQLQIHTLNSGKYNYFKPKPYRKCMFLQLIFTDWRWLLGIEWRHYTIRINSIAICQPLPLIYGKTDMNFYSIGIALNIHAKTECGCLGNTETFLVISLVNKLTKIQRECT